MVQTAVVISPLPLAEVPFSHDSVCDRVVLKVNDPVMDTAAILASTCAF